MWHKPCRTFHPWCLCTKTRCLCWDCLTISNAIRLDPFPGHHSNVVMGTTASQITSLTIVYSIVYKGADQRKHQSSPSLAFVWGIHRWPVNSPHKWPVTQKMFSFDDVFVANKYAFPIPDAPHSHAGYSPTNVICLPDWVQTLAQDYIPSLNKIID